jgi:hypothetical protein
MTDQRAAWWIIQMQRRIYLQDFTLGMNRQPTLQVNIRYDFRKREEKYSRQLNMQRIAHWFFPPLLITSSNYAIGSILITDRFLMIFGETDR